MLCHRFTHHLVPPPDPSSLDASFKQEVREGVSKRGIFVGPAAQAYAEIDTLPLHVGAAAYLSEEARFRTNPGFDLGLMRRAIRTGVLLLSTLDGGVGAPC